jgi:hypothetical protein
MSAAQTKSVILFTVIIIAAVTFIEETNQIYEGGKQGVKGSKKIAKGGESLFIRLLFLGLAFLVFTFGADMAPEFMGPFTLLVLVAFLVNKAPELSDYFQHKGQFS